MDRRFSVDDVVLEITRKCNLECAHCLRGDARDLDLDPKVISAFWKKIREVNTLTFTGGEPLLNRKGMLKFVEERTGDISRFYIATNGFIANPETIGTLARIFAAADDPEDNFLQVSNTAYHLGSARRAEKDPDFSAAQLQERNYRLFSGVFHSVSKKYEANTSEIARTGSYPPLLARGRAKYKDDAVDNNVLYPWDIDLAERRVSVQHLYITCQGDCFPYCDLSYSDMDSLKKDRHPLFLGNITDPRVTVASMASKWNTYVADCGGTVRVRDVI